MVSAAQECAEVNIQEGGGEREGGTQ